MIDVVKRKKEILDRLGDRVEELNRQNMIMLGCRLRIVSLKREIKNLKEKLEYS